MTQKSCAPPLIQMIVKGRRQLTPSIDEFIIESASGDALPEFTPGSHICVKTPCGAMRRYSLVNPPQQAKTYVIAVKREPDSRGGSSSMHDQAGVGTQLAIESPTNDFGLVPAERYLLIAGGIGITPILSMARQLKDEGKPFELVYCTRSAEDTAYLGEVRAEFTGCLTLHHDAGDPERIYDFWDRFEKPDNSHVYCCGPAGLMEEIRAVSGHWPDGRVHFEDFKPVEVVHADDVPFAVTLADTGEIISVPADRTILEALRDTGISTTSSCESGTCGTCKCKLVEGDVDHRDMVLMDEERDTHIMICVSRAASGDLVIDL